MAYIAAFVISSVLIDISEKEYRRKKKRASNALAIVTIIGIALFAGIRDVSVGTDVRYYLISHFNTVGLFEGKPLEYLTYMTTKQEAEPLYALIQYVGYHHFHNIHFVMFVIALIINGFVLLGLQEKRQDISVAFGWIIYCLIFFNTSLNIFRQSTAVAIVWYITNQYSENRIKPIRYIILLLIAAGFHRTAIVIGPMLLMLMWLCRNKSAISKTLAVTPCFLPFIFRYASSIFQRLSFLPEKYLLYFNKLNAGQSSVFFDAIIYLLPTSLLLYMYVKKKSDDKGNILFYLIICICCVSCCMVSNLLLNRVSYYLIVFFCYSVPISSQIISKEKQGRLIYSTVIIFWFAVMWYINIVYFGYGETYPYLISTGVI